MEEKAFFCDSVTSDTKEICGRCDFAHKKIHLNCALCKVISLFLGPFHQPRAIEAKDFRINSDVFSDYRCIINRRSKNEVSVAL